MHVIPDMRFVGENVDTFYLDYVANPGIVKKRQSITINNIVFRGLIDENSIPK
jgi:hypothetical protein